MAPTVVSLPRAASRVVERSLPRPRDVTAATSGSRPSRRTSVPAREPSATRPWTDALAIPASTGDSSANRPADAIAASLGSRPRRPSSRRARQETVASTSANSSSLGGVVKAC